MALPHATAGILSIGDELTLGQNLDTNSQWLSQQLVARGITPIEHTTVADSLAATRDALLRLAASCDVLIVSGGLGPTADDLTRGALAAAMDDTLVEDPESMAQIAAWFAGRTRPMPPLNRVQALRPSRAAAIANPAGTAPGIQGMLSIRGREVDVFCLPGPPREMRPMFQRHVAPRLRAARMVRTRALLTFGLGESEIAMRLGELMSRNQSPLVGTTASQGVVACRIRYDGAPGQGDDEAAAAIAKVEAKIREVLGPYVFGVEGDSLQSVVLGLLASRGETLATVESCTGGLAGALLTEVPGSSAVYAGGFVTYSNRLKEQLVGVPGSLLAPGGPGAVSRDVAEAMARGGRERLGTGWSIAITGIAGPDGGTPEKPVGTVWIAVASRDAVWSRKFLFAGERAYVRDLAASSSLAMLRLALIGEVDLPLIRQVM